MSAPIRRHADIFDREPSMTAEGDAVAISAALWTFSEGRHFDLQGVPDPHHHIVSLPSAGRHRCTYFGNGRERFSGEPTPFRMNLVHAEELPAAHLRTETATEYLHIYVPHRFLQELVERAPRRSHIGLELCADAKDLDPVIAHIGQSVLSEMERADPFSRLRVDALGLDLGVHLLRRHSSLSGAPASSPPRRSVGLAPWQLKRACVRMQDDLAAEPSLRQLAGLVGLSPEHFCRAFRRSTGLPPHRWLAVRRMEQAQAYLLDPKLSLTEIAQRVGYTGQAAFGAAFRRTTGVTPSAWRRERLS